MKAPFLLGRMMFGGFFLYNSIHHFQEYKQLAQYAKAKNVPMAEAAVLGTGALLAVGGASLLLGAKPKIGSLAVLTFLAGVAPTLHDFWNEGDPGQKQNAMAHFGKNLALFGAGLALLGVDEPWEASVGSQTEEDGEDGSTEEERPLRLSQRRAMQKRAA